MPLVDYDRTDTIKEWERTTGELRKGDKRTKGIKKRNIEVTIGRTIEMNAKGIGEKGESR
jgi:hypothetical protein